MSSPSDRDIYALALQLLKLHGADGASFHAAQRADELLQQNEADGVRMWARVLKAIDELSDKPPPIDRVRH